MHEVSYLRKVIYEIHEFPELLSLRGHDVTFFDFDEGANTSNSKSPRIREISGRVHSNARITLATPHCFGLGALDRLWAIFSAVPLLIKLFKSKKFDVVLNFAVPTYGLQVMLLSRFFKVPVVHRALDVSSEIRESLWNPLIAVWEKLVLALANSISANNPSMKDYVERLIVGQATAKEVQVDYPPLDLSISRPTEYSTKLAQELGLAEGDKVIVYMGSFFYFSGLDEVLRVFARNARKHSNLKLLLIGGGEQESELRSLSLQLNVQDQVIFTGFIPFVRLSEFMSLGDIAINPLKPSQVASAAFPQKVLQYLGTGLPVVSTRLDGLLRAFGDKVPTLEWSNSPAETAEIAIEKLLSGQIPSKHARRTTPLLLEELFSPEAATQGLEDHLQRVIASYRKHG